jgi:auxin efflux carrier family
MASSLITGALIGKFAVSIAPIYFTFALGARYYFLNILTMDHIPAISVLIQYVSLPALLFLRLATNDPSQLDLKLLGADGLSKLIPLIILLLWWKFFSKFGKIESLEWVITFWMLATLPNTVLIGDQILSPMFTIPVGAQTTTIIFAQSLYWYNCVILMMEIREVFIEEQQAKASSGDHAIPTPGT